MRTPDGFYHRGIGKRLPIIQNLGSSMTYKTHRYDNGLDRTFRALRTTPYNLYPILVQRHAFDLRP